MTQTKQTCLVTGASSGIGEALAREMILKGWRVIGIARSVNNLNALSKELGENFIAYPCDVAKEESVKAVSNTLKEKQRIDTVLNVNP
jgi:NADP-dependent 3-hydroxy acid dehydrogenase YdfG